MAPVIIATDKTQLTQFSGNKSAYPVYLTLGNIPKALRRKPGSRACVLIAYLSVDKPAKAGLSKTTLKLRNYQLFHRSMAVVLESLKAAGNPKGPGVEMVGGGRSSSKGVSFVVMLRCRLPGTVPSDMHKVRDMSKMSAKGRESTSRYPRGASDPKMDSEKD